MVILEKCKKFMVIKMDKLFSEIFGCYYKTITEIINNSPITEENLKNIIIKNGFQESYFHLLPLIKDLPFIEKRGDKYYSLLNNKIKIPLTNIEKAWLKSISQDTKFKLFNKNTDIEAENNLYENNLFKYFDRYSDGDNFNDEKYIENFKRINKALDNKEIVEITYRTTKQQENITGFYIPLQIEFSSKDNKFRFFAARIFKQKVVDYVCINFSRISEIKESSEILNNREKINSYIKKFEKKEIVEVEIKNSRNAIERFMIELSTYEKESEFNPEKGTCTTKIYYRKKDECEILMKILSFGPVVKGLSACQLKEKLKEKINIQFNLNKVKR